MKGNFQKYKYHPWFRGFRRICGQFIIPFIIFQGIRTLLIPTVFDILLLCIFLMIAAGIFFEII
jgi:retron-type reverse transcriptase